MTRSIYFILCFFWFLMSTPAVREPVYPVLQHEHTGRSSLAKEEYESKDMKTLFWNLWKSMGLRVFLSGEDEPGSKSSPFHRSLGRIIMLGICLTLIYLAIAKGFEPLLLIPIGFGGLFANVPIANIAGSEGLIGILYSAGIENG